MDHYEESKLNQLQEEAIDIAIQKQNEKQIAIVVANKKG